jgi:hypothetical protein
LLWYEPWKLLQYIMVIIGFTLAARLFGMLLAFVENFPESAETWPNWLRWLACLPGSAILLISLGFAGAFVHDHFSMPVPGLFGSLLVHILGALYTFACAMVFIVFGTAIAPHFRVVVAILLSLIALWVDVAMFVTLATALPASEYTLIVVLTGVVGVVAGWVMAYKMELFE